MNIPSINEMNITKICNMIILNGVEQRIKTHINNGYELTIINSLIRHVATNGDEDIYDNISIGCYVYIEPVSVCDYDYGTVLKFTANRDNETFENNISYREWNLTIDGWK